MKPHEHLVESSAGDFSRKVWVLDAPNSNPEKVGIFLDGEFYLNQMDAPSILHHLQKTETIPPMLCAFVSHVDGHARHHDLTCNSKYSDFIAEDVFAFVRAMNPYLTEKGNLIAGPSLGGLAAAYLSLGHPQLFSTCLSQSGSFWWKDEWLKNNFNALSTHKSTFWLSVGDKETQSGVSHPPPVASKVLTPW